MVGRRGEAPLVPPYRFRRPNKAMALVREQPRNATTSQYDGVACSWTASPRRE